MNRAIGDVAAIKFATGFDDPLGAEIYVGCTLQGLWGVRQTLKASRDTSEKSKNVVSG